MSSGVMWKGTAMSVALLASSFLGSIFILFPFLPLILVTPKLWRTCADRFVGFWLSFPVAIVELFHGSRFRISGDDVLSDHPGLMIMNHRTRLDWLFFWSALFKMDPWLLVSEKISLKASLKKIPGAGWAMECNNFIFLARNWGEDQRTLSDAIQYYAAMERPYQLLLFPEGTDMCPKSRARMEKYAAENGLPVYANVLHPKTTGLCHILREMRANAYLDYVYDVICAYGDEIVQTEVEFALGHCSKEVHFHVERYHVSEIPEEEAAVVAWVREIWSLKEAILADFYAQPASERCLEASVRKFRRPRPSIGLDGAPDGGRGEEEVRVKPIAFQGRQRVFIAISLAFWITTSLVWTYLFFVLSTLRLYFALAVVSFIAIQRLWGGLDHLAIWAWKRSRPMPQKND